MLGSSIRRLSVVALVLIGLLETPAASAAVGRTPTSFDVSATGESSYVIPIFTPPGTRGMRPQLALAYGHRSGGSLVGVGWNIAGLSAIRRCARTWAQDGNPGAVSLTYADRFCLDGNQLRLVSGTYGNPNAQYRTEIETFARITSLGTAGNGPANFKVEHKNGLTYEYGSTEDSRIQSVGSATARAWALHKIKDRDGNAIVFTYTEDPTNGSYRLISVDYTSNPDQGLSPAYRVAFTYVTKPIGEIDSAYLAGGLIKELTRLTRIDVTYNTTLVRRYNLTYEASLSSTSQSRLASVQECAGTTPDCYTTNTTFAYQNGTNGLGSEVASGTTIPTPASALPLDVNGDGRTDIVYSSSTTSGGGTWRYMLANSSGGYAAWAESGIANTNYSQAIPIDYNADGLEDFLVPYSGGTWWVVYGTSTGLATSAVNTGIAATGAGGNARAIDVNGDGLQDLVWANIVGGGNDSVQVRHRVLAGTFESTPSYLISPVGVNNAIVGPVFGTYHFRSRSRTPDFNGDGHEDFIVHFTEFDPEFQTTLHSWEAVLTGGAGGFAITSLNIAGFPYYLDLNGDGYTDLIYKWNTQWRYRFSRGTSFGPEILGPTNSLVSTSGVVVDWDHDGYEDLVLKSNSPATWYYMRSTGEALATAVNSGLSHNSIASFAGDVNGDGMDDLLSGSTSSAWTYRPHAGVKPDLLATATDGFGTAAQFAYAPLTDATAYTKGSGAVYPEMDIQSPRYVVKQLTSTDGTGTTATFATTYAYETARVNLHGRGFLGFARRTATDPRFGYNQKTEENYLQTFPYTGLPASVMLKNSSGQKIREVTNSWSALPYSSGLEARFYPYVYNATRKLYEGLTHFATITTTLPGSQGADGIDNTSGLVFDATTTTTEVATGIHAGSSRSERVYHSAIFNDPLYWCLGRPDYSQSINSHTLTGGGTKTRTVDPSWDAVKCRLTQQIIAPGDPDWAVTTALGYDSFGNVNSQTVTGAAMSARTATINWGTTGQFPESITKSVSPTVSHTITQGFRHDFGLQTSLTDPNNLTTSWQYDDFGRRTLETRPDGTKTAWTLTAHAGDPPRSRYYVAEIWLRDDDVPIRQTQIWFDQFDRPYYHFVQIPATGGYAWSTTKSDFDARGRVIKRHNPWILSGAPAGYWSITYDQIDRVTAEKLYTSADVLDRQTTHAFDGLSVITTDPKSYQTTRYSTAWGDLTQVTDALGGSTHYQYEAFGLLTQVTDALSNVVSSIGYNIRGMKTNSTDMDMGTWTYLPNALGEMEKIRDAKTVSPAWTTQTTFDHLSRPTQRIEAEGTTAFTWGTSAASKNIGQLQSVSRPGYSESLTYDSKARLATRSITTDTTYQIDYGYHANTALLDTLTYPVSTASYRFKLQYEYAYGTLSKVKRFDSPSTEYWKLNTVDARGNPLDEDLGNGLKVVSGFDPLTGLMDYRQTGPGGGTSIQNLEYEWDLNGNLSQRKDKRQSDLTEAFTYDALNRLATVTLNGAPTLTVDYDLIGNITKKSDVSANTWTYHATRKHAVTATGGGPTYSYDANGNVSAKSGSSITWYSFNLPNVINGSGVSSQFWYGPGRERIKHVANFTSGSETTHYVGGLLEKVESASTTHYKHYIASPSGLVATYTRRATGTPLEDTFYFTHDHLGSIDSVTNQSAVMQVRLSFDALGKRRKEAGWSGAVPSGDWTAIATTTRRGYTEHELIDNLTLTHMNGRVYDQTIGRFLSADPFVQAPDYSQSLNRFAYVWNSPLTFTDPSGFGAEIKDEDEQTANDPPAAPPIGELMTTASRIHPYRWNPPPLGLAAFNIVGNLWRSMVGESGGSGGGANDSNNDERAKEEECRTDPQAAADARARSRSTEPILPAGDHPVLHDNELSAELLVMEVGGSTIHLFDLRTGMIHQYSQGGLGPASGIGASLGDLRGEMNVGDSGVASGFSANVDFNAAFIYGFRVSADVLGGTSARGSVWGLQLGFGFQVQYASFVRSTPVEDATSELKNEFSRAFNRCMRDAR